MKIYDFEQRSPEWFEIRCGLPTASNFDKIITTKGEPSKQAIKYLYKTAGEAVSGTAEESYQNAVMQRGIEMEEEARNLYQVLTDEIIEPIGFCLVEGYGCSPDGLVGKDGIVEIKCPIISTHVEYLLANKLPTTYIQQVQGQLLVTGRKWCDFVSYYPGLKPLIIRVERDEVFIEALKKQLDAFCKELKIIINKIK